MAPVAKASSRSSKAAAKAKPKPAAKKPAAKKPAAKAKPAAKKPATPSKKSVAKAPPAKKPTPPAKKPAKLVAKSTPLARDRAVAAPPPPTAPAAPSPARFAFAAVPIIRDPAGLTPLLREQLAADARLRTGRVTTPDRIPASYLSPGVVRWRVSEGKKPVLDVVADSAFFPDSAEPLGLERTAGLWQPTGRGSDRGRALDLPRLAWELTRDWPGRRIPLGPEPKPGARWKPLPPIDESPWPDGTAFV